MIQSKTLKLEEGVRIFFMALFGWVEWQCRPDLPIDNSHPKPDMNCIISLRTCWITIFSYDLCLPNQWTWVIKDVLYNVSWNTADNVDVLLNAIVKEPQVLLYTKKNELI